MKLLERRELKGLILYHEGDRLLFSRGYKLYESRDGGATETLLARLPRATWRERLAIGTLGRRFFRAYIRHALPWGEQIVALAGRRFYRITPAGSSGPRRRRRAIVEAGAFAVGSQPFHLAVTPLGLYYGEYRSNLERSPVGLYRSEDGGLSFTKVLELEGVRHIHGVFTDPLHQGSLLLATGDDDDESAIWHYWESDGSLERIAGGSQQYRAVTVVPSGQFLYYGSDTPRERNHLYRLDRKSGAAQELAEVGGSVFWGTGTPDGTIAFSTVVEPSEVNTTEFAELWTGSSANAFSLGREEREDRLHPNLFQYAQIRFPAGPGAPGLLWITPFACPGHERSVLLEIAEESE